MKDKLYKILGYTLLIVGVIGIGSSFYIGYVGEKNNKEMIDNFAWDNVLDIESNIDVLEEDSADNNTNDKTNQFANNTYNQ